MKLTKKLLAMALAGVMLLTILTGCSGGKTGDRLVEEYIAAHYHSSDAYKGIPITTNDVPEIKTFAEKFDPAWLNVNGLWNIRGGNNSDDERCKALQKVFSKYSNSNGYTVVLYACKVDSKQSELNQALRVMSPTHPGLAIYSFVGDPSITAIQCATRLVTRGDESYRIAVVIYDHTAN